MVLTPSGCIFSFFTEPGQGGESDIRTTYCAFAISSMLNDWSGLDVDRATEFIARCRVRNIQKANVFYLPFLLLFQDV